MDSSMTFESQFKEVSAWLENILDRESIPEFEINEFTLGVLNSIMKANKELEKIVHILIDDINRQREEYEAEALVLTQRLTDIGLPIQSLSQASHRNLNTLSDVALNLRLKDCKHSSYALGIGDISSKIAEYTSEIAKQEKAITNIKGCIVQIEKEKDDLKSSLDALRIQSLTEEPTLDKKRKEKQFLNVKAQEYHKVISDIKSINSKNGLSEQLFHRNLTTYQKELLDMHSTIDKLKSTLSQYHNLPPDMPLAKVKIAEARQELQYLEGELYDSLEVLNL